jgi:diguanylate cyclase (GGDEF)-like protein
MPHIVESLADLTSLRDREALDSALVSAISDVLESRMARICRVVGEPGNERWRISAELQAGHGSLFSDSAWAQLDALPRLDDFPLRAQAAATCQPQESIGSANVTVFPLGGTLGSGVLELKTDAPLSQESRRLVGGILRLYLNFSNLLDYGERDSLTELLNRKTFDGAFLKATLEQQRASNEMEHRVAASAERRDSHAAGSYWLAMIDIDHFKRVNDNYGHLIGDEVLLLLSRLMRAHFRFYDQLYRFGGEEFVVLMRCNGEAEAARVLERLRKTTERHSFPQVGTISISIGFSEIKSGDSPSSAFERADKAVYYAKEHGRNQSCSYASLVSTGALVDQAANIGDVELF